ncbi:MULTISPECIES: S-layer homology domain-containing protein [unclassified Sporosarcina]|uniref:S-layer homology domain-containing protein n=1 Tax=unclassified Sporosarcina TaxID=2647733 RepID=UPI000C172234|nr:MULTISPECIES: S-layer homology domain-containing protein [unclassified Sporosarcina]PIC99607.1 Parasporal protein [Sporosarcina sp. P29]PID06413.1 Parasporal protein [Sporosarcina sp. P30]PID09607.1 Parasporal protein [Sporosarcina sp. P31]PID13184.1 Parasporal protein [Sporosarcina sp. P32b]
MKKIIMIIGAIILTLSLPLSSTAASTQRFPDVAPSHHFAEAVNDFAARNIIGGYPDGTFKPGNPITRGQAAAIIAKLTKLDMTKIKNPGFKDVSIANGYYKAIAALAEAGIISGYGDGRYGPNDYVTRGQFASILVKAFDLPRYDFHSIKNPFRDIHVSQSHGENILILYKLGITTGTSSNTFGINAAVTRGQAAKLMKATEEKKPSMVTLEAEDVGMDKIDGVIRQTDTDLYESVMVYGKPGYTKTKIQLIPLKEGKGTLNVSGRMLTGASIEKGYHVQVEKVSGVLKLRLQETDDYLPTEAPLEISAGEKIQNISLSTVDGKFISDNIVFKNCPSTISKPDNMCIKIDQPGEYIATVHFVTGAEVRYAIEAKLPKNAYFYYEIQTMRERLSYTFDIEDLFEDYHYFDQEVVKNIGKHTILTDSAETIATITRTPGTNIFHTTAKSNGSVTIQFEKLVWGSYHEISDGMPGIVRGISIDVQEMYGIINISASTIFEGQYGP